MIVWFGFNWLVTCLFVLGTVGFRACCDLLVVCIWVGLFAFCAVCLIDGLGLTVFVVF